MYNDTGKKILTMANVLTVISIILSLIIGIGAGVLVGGGIGFGIAIIIIAVGCVLAWVSNLVLAGFGELVSNTHEILKIAKTQIPQVEKKTTRGNQGIESVIQTTPLPQVTEAPTEQTAPLIRRAFLALEDGEWDKADEIFEQLLNLEPENAKVYIGKLCAELKIHHEEDLLNYSSPFSDNSNFKRAIQFSDNKHRAMLEWYALTPEQRRELESSDLEDAYRALINRIDRAKENMQKSGDHVTSYQLFTDSKECAEFVSELERLGNYKDAAQILVELSTPIADGDKAICNVCGASQQTNRPKCYRCGIEFFKGLGQ